MSDIASRFSISQPAISRTVAENGLEMFSLNLWRELAPCRRIAFEQSFCTPEGTKCPPPYFDDWPCSSDTWPA